MAIRQLLHYESGTVQLADGQLFSPMTDANDRWVQIAPCSYRILGNNARALYRVPDIGFVLVDYPYCNEVEQGRHRGLWVSDDPPTGRVVDDQFAAHFLLQNQFSLPPDLHEASTRPKPVRRQPTPRPLETWSNCDLFTHCSILSHTVDPLQEAEQIRSVLVSVVQSVQSGARRDIDFLWALLFRKYQVDADWWYKQHSGFPPEFQDLLELDWPPKTEAIRASLRSLRELLHVPLAALLATKTSIDSELHPTAAEQQLAEEAFARAMPETKQAAERLIAALSACANSNGEPDPSDGDRIQGVFQNSSNRWTIKFREQQHSISHRKGMDYIRELLARQGQRLGVFELEAAVVAMPIVEGGSAGENLDWRAISEIQKAYAEIEEQLEDARDRNDGAEVERLREQLSPLASRLSSAIGLGRRVRKDKDETERARKRVSGNINRAIKHIREVDKQLADHLEMRITQGQSFQYDPGEPISWDL